jgi:hypothetical protein
MDLGQLGKSVLLAGAVLVILGGILLVLGKVPFLGKLPGDIRVERDNFSFYFPIVTCLVLSAFVSLAYWLFSRFK